jgi:hypothetical protein
MGSCVSVDCVRRVGEALRRRYPAELRGALTWNGLRSILGAERIPLVPTTMVRPAALIAGGGVAVMLINNNVPGRRHLAFAAHELAHRYLHAHEDDGAAEVCYHMDVDWSEDPREDEAELLAVWLLGSAAVRRSFATTNDPVQLRLELDSVVGRER